MINWRRWIGLPHQFGEHPGNGRGADCLIMVWAILDSVGVYHPPFDYKWLELARAAEWEKLQALWDAATEPVPEIEEFSVCLFENGANGLGVGIVVENGVLVVHHKRGVCWLPPRAMRESEYRRFVQ